MFCPHVITDMEELLFTAPIPLKDTVSIKKTFVEPLSQWAIHGFKFFEEYPQKPIGGKTLGQASFIQILEVWLKKLFKDGSAK